MPEIQIKQIKAFLDDSRVPVSLADPEQDDCPLVYVNPAFEILTGYNADDVIGGNCRFLQGEGTDPNAVKTIGDAIRARKSASSCLLNFRRDGSSFHNMLYVDPLVLKGDRLLIMGCQFAFDFRTSQPDVETYTETLSTLISRQQSVLEQSKILFQQSMKARKESTHNLLQLYLNYGHMKG